MLVVFERVHSPYVVLASQVLVKIFLVEGLRDPVIHHHIGCRVLAQESALRILTTPNYDVSIVCIAILDGLVDDVL